MTTPFPTFHEESGRIQPNCKMVFAYETFAAVCLDRKIICIPGFQQTKQSNVEEERKRESYVRGWKYNFISKHQDLRCMEVLKYIV
jgi:hypothetical protein